MIGFSWLESQGVQDIINGAYEVLKIIRIIVPIGLIVMTTFDVIKKVINPNEKDGQKKIMVRALAAIIVFFVPTLVRISFDIMGVDIDNLSLDPGTNDSSSNNDNKKNNNNNSKNNGSEKVKDDIDKNKLSTLSITNCNSDIEYQPGAKFTLNTNIPTSYTGNILWSTEREEKILKISGSKDKASATFEVVANPTNYYEKVTVSAGGKSYSCTISVAKAKLDSIKFLDCNNSKRYIVGDSITLTTSIPSTYAGEITWKVDNNIFKIDDNSKKTQITFHIINRPKNGFNTINVVAGGTAASCFLSIASVPKLSITNCPSENTVYHIGDKIHLKTNLPKDYNGETMWDSYVTPDVFKITPINNGLEVELEVIKKPEFDYGYISLVADQDNATCEKIKIE